MDLHAPDQGRAIFRADAIRHHAEGRNRVVLPALTSPRTFAALWATLSISLCVAGGVWRVRIPKMVTGAAVVAQDRAAKRPVLLALFPPEAQPLLAEGQRLELATGPSPEVRAVGTALPEALPPRELRRRYQLPRRAALFAATASAVLAKDDPRDAELSEDAVYPVSVQIGTRPVGSLLPIVGRYFH